MFARRLPLLFFILLCVASVIGALAYLDSNSQAPSLENATPVFPTTLSQVNKHNTQAPALDIATWQTQAGSKVLFLHTDQIPMVELRLTFNAGGARDGNLPGLAALTNAMLNQGSAGLSVDDIALGFENLGAAFSLGSYRDMAVASLTSLANRQQLDQAVSLYSQVLAKPDFSASNLDRLRTRALQSLKVQQQTPAPQLERAYQAALFAGHPYGQPEDGTESSLAQITPEHLQAFHQRYYTAANATLAIVGDISAKQAAAMAEKISTALPSGAAAEPLPEASEQPASSTHITFNSSQTHITLGNQMIKRGHPDYVPLYVGNHILGGSGFSAILMDEVRQQRGLVYGIYSSINPMAAAGPFTLKLQTANHNKDEALALTLRLLDNFVEQGPTDEQLALAISDLTGSFALGTASNAALVGQLSNIGFYDLPLDYLAQFHHALGAVSKADIQRAFKRHLHPSKLVITSIGPEAPAPTTEENRHEQE